MVASAPRDWGDADDRNPHRSRACVRPAAVGRTRRGDRGEQLRCHHQRHALCGRDGERLLQAAGRERHRHPLLRWRRHHGAHFARRQSRLRRGQPDRDRDRDPAGRGPQDRQRQRADGRGIHLGGEAGFADQDRRGSQGQEDRLHQSPLDQPGAGDPGAGEGRPEADRRGTGEDRRLRRRHRGARPRRGRHHADPRAALVGSIRPNTARWCGRASFCRRSTMWSA